MTQSLNDLNDALYEQKYLFAFAALSIFTVNSINNLVEYFENQGDKKGNLGLLKQSHMRNTLLESDKHEPPFTASFNELMLSNSQIGMRVIPIGGAGYVEFGDVLELYDTIISQIGRL